MDYSLNLLQPGEKAYIQTVMDKGALRRRMMDMGLVPGAEVEVIRLAPWGGPMQIRVKRYYLAMRLSECAKILVGRN
ncbi:FeoA family protein [Desulfitobacterium sp.]|uniref:FeoA family protein n=1 Tax=Desulfitobacterium sp. TaxID=49981 RepID=UPI002B62F152|nr:FeoA family protein [Desulfitobacterium sp.]HVJ50411.1 FeoA family protein [Desulfitobacterium sp.]